MIFSRMNEITPDHTIVKSTALSWISTFTTQEGNRLSIEDANGDVRTFVLDGESEVASDRGLLSVRAKIEKGTIVVETETPRGKIVETYRLDPEEDRLRVRMKIKSEGPMGGLTLERVYDPVMFGTESES